MDTRDHDVEVVEKLLCERARFYAAPAKFRTLSAFDREQGQFLVFDEGWDGYCRIHRVWAHVELREDRFWIHEDGTEEGIANLLVSAGVSANRIVLAFLAPSQRSASEFATA